MFRLSNAEFMILSLVQEDGPVSGYRLNSLIAERGYRAWADVGSTSVYVSLKKLDEKGLICGELVADKRTRGPAARLFSITGKGTECLRSEIADGLSATRERDKRFDLALSAAPLVGWSRVAALLRERVRYLESEHSRLRGIRVAQADSITFTGQALFDHTLHLIAAEAEFLRTLINSIEEKRHDWSTRV